MQFNLINNHIIISVETDKGTKNCVFDTGSPVSFFFDSVREFCIDGQTHIVSPNPMSAMLALYRPHIEKMIGTQIDGFIGTDCLKNSNVLLDFPDAQLSISSETLDEAFRVPMRNMLGLPVFEMSVNATAVYAAFDSGAMYSFVSSESAEKLSLISQNKNYEDFNPMLGHFTANLYTGNIRIGEKDLGVHNIAVSEAYDKVLQMMGVNAFLGTDALRQSVIGFSYVENRMGVMTKANNNH